MDLEKSSAPVPGWYVDPEHPGSERYWDGNLWTEQRRPTQVSTATSAPSSGFAITALVCGIVGIVLVIFFVGWILGIIAIVFGVLGRKRADSASSGGRKGMATAGLVLGIIAVALSILYIVLIVAVLDTTFSTWDEFTFCLDHPDAARCN